MTWNDNKDSEEDALIEEKDGRIANEGPSDRYITYAYPKERERQPGRGTVRRESKAKMTSVTRS